MMKGVSSDREVESNSQAKRRDRFAISKNERLKPACLTRSVFLLSEKSFSQL